MSLTRMDIATPRRVWPIGGLALLLALLLVIPSCGASKAEVRAAQNSGYDTEFANVYDAALSTISKYYPYLAVEDANQGIIKTRWHPVRNLSAEDDPHQSDRTTNMVDPVAVTSGGPVRKMYFIRVQAYVVGGNPWRVRVDGQASEWDAGGVPTPLYGANVPPWLRGRLNALRVQIHEKLKPYAVKLELTSTATKAREQEEPAVVEVDQSYLGALPPDALAVVVDTLSAAKARDYQALAAVMHSEFSWSLGAPPSAEQALIMWQADSSLLDRLVAVLEAGCAVEAADRRIACPDGAALDGYRAVFENGAGGWKMTSFTRAD